MIEVTHGSAVMEDGMSLGYRVCVPGGKNLPLAVILETEGSASAGLSEIFTSEDAQAANPCNTLIIECPAGRYWNERYVWIAAAGLVHKSITKTDADEFKVYLTGCGDNAAGVWRLMAKYPRMWAAVLPISGCGDPYEIRTAKFVPVWAIHGSDDRRIDKESGATVGCERFLAGSFNMVASLRGQGNMDAKYSESESAYADANAVSKDVLLWLFSKDRKKQYDVNWIRPGVWHIEDYFRASCYLVEGQDKALLIDTTMGHFDLMGAIRGLTRLPVELAVTHAHGDHFMHGSDFDAIYMHENDIATLPAMYERFAALFPSSWKKPNDASIVPVREGYEINLGGGVNFKVLELFGHTPGSVAFCCEEMNLIFTGDAFGSGEIVLLWGGEGEINEVITDYKANVAHFLEEVKKHPDLVYYGGHRLQDATCELLEQEKVLAGGVTHYNAIGIPVLEDYIKLCDKIIAGDVQGVEGASMGVKTLRYMAGKAGIVYRIR